MEKLYRVKRLEEEYSKISFAHDLNLEQREESKKLYEQAKEKQKNEKGEYVYRVRGLPGNMYVVRLKKRNV